MKNPLFLPIAALVAAMTLAACAPTRTTESTGEYVDDAAITSKVKADLLGDSGLKSFAIGVDTDHDIVKLSGVVNSNQVKARARDIAASVAGVRGVQNNLVVQ